MRFKILTAVLLAGAMAGGTAHAQSGGTGIDQRVGKLEKEMKAVQRTVFPQGAPVTPDINTTPAPATAAGNPASDPVSDLTSRVDALEKGLAALTGQVEQNGFRGRQADDAIKRLEVRLATLEGTGPTDPAAASDGPAPATGGPAPDAVKPATTSIARPTAAKPAVAAKPDPGRKTAVAAIEIPSTGDAAEDAYTYGYRLYTAKFDPEAQVKLKEFVAKYPAHKRASYAQNLLGRAYYDEGKPALASVAFYDNYQKMPKGERAPESLFWLGQSLTRLKKLPDACKVYDELDDVYAARLTSDLRAKTAKGRADAKCTA